MNGYATSSATPDDQQKEAGVWLWTEFNDVLADAGFGDVDVFWADNRGKMKMAEAGYLAIQSFALIILSIVFVYVYMLLMLDSIFMATMSMMQIFLCFVPAILIYTYVFGVECEAFDTYLAPQLWAPISRPIMAERLRVICSRVACAALSPRVLRRLK